jgi:integrase
MPRPPLELGQPGRISTRQIGDKLWAARCRFREHTGETVALERRAPTETGAERRLQSAIRERRGPSTEPLRPHDKFERAAQLWLTRFETLVAEGHRTDTTLDLYRGQLEYVVLPALGQLRIRECTIGRLDMFFAGLAQKQTRNGGTMSAKYRQSIRIVVKHVLQQAVKHEALPFNPVREIDPIEGGTRRHPRALTPEERRRLFAWMAGIAEDPTVRKAQESARRQELPDLITLMIGTGVRIGEALGLRWCDVDLDGVPVSDGADGLRLQPVIAITGNIVAVKGKGLVRNHGKTERALRVVPLPRFVADMLAARRPDDRSAEDPVFVTVGRAGLTWRHPRNVSGQLLDMRRAAGISWPMTSHTFRKTAATIWHDAGTLSDRQAADLVGHAQITTLLNTYVARGELHPQAAAVMDAAWMDT